MALRYWLSCRRCRRCRVSRVSKSRGGWKGTV